MPLYRATAAGQVQMTPEEEAEFLALQLTAEQVREQAVFTECQQMAQARLDAFARTRNYDGILSACTYASSTVPKFASEGQYCVEARDATWASLYAILAGVEAGTRPMPSGYAEVEQELPVLEWPQ